MINCAQKLQTSLIHERGELFQAVSQKILRPKINSHRSRQRYSQYLRAISQGKLLNCKKSQILFRFVENLGIRMTVYSVLMTSCHWKLILGLCYFL